MRPSAKIGATPPRWSATNRAHMLSAPWRDRWSATVPRRFLQSVFLGQELLLKCANDVLPRDNEAQSIHTGLPCNLMVSSHRRTPRVVGKQQIARIAANHLRHR